LDTANLDDDAAMRKKCLLITFYSYFRKTVLWRASSKFLLQGKCLNFSNKENVSKDEHELKVENTLLAPKGI
ncbi:hypothetical protein SDJN02_04416, partial [Cucurbita argyrosperma subsp. argyrosperma]